MVCAQARLKPVLLARTPPNVTSPVACCFNHKLWAYGAASAMVACNGLCICRLLCTYLIHWHQSCQHCVASRDWQAEFGGASAALRQYANGAAGTAGAAGGSGTAGGGSGTAGAASVWGSSGVLGAGGALGAASAMGAGVGADAAGQGAMRLGCTGCALCGCLLKMKPLLGVS